jgi:hypothetical protein
MLNLKNRELCKHKIILGLFKKIIYIILIAILLITILSCVKLKQGPVVVITVPETKAPETTVAPEITAVKTTTPEIIGSIEYKGSVFPLPEASEANPQTGEIFALVGNLYGVEAGTKIGQCIIDAFELNGKMEDSIALIPEVIEVLQMQQFKEKGKIFIPIPVINLNEAKGIKINEVKSMFNREGTEDKYTSLVFTVPEMTDVYSFLTTEYTGDTRTGLGITTSFFEPKDVWYGFFYEPSDKMPKENLAYEGFQRIDVIDFTMWCLEAKIGDPLLEEKVNSAEQGFKTSTKAGDLLCKIIAPPNEDLTKQIFSGFGSIEIFLRLQQGKDHQLEKELITGKDILLEVDKTKVSILTAQ